MKKIIFLIIILAFFSCKEKNTEFIQSRTIKNLFLVKNPPKIDSLVKKEVILFLVKNPPKDDGFPEQFYLYNSDTKYFLDHDEDPGGFSSEEFANYQDESGIGIFGYIKCEKDSTKKVGIIRYYNEKYGNFYQPDTIIGECK